MTHLAQNEATNRQDLKNEAEMILGQPGRQLWMNRQLQRLQPSCTRETPLMIPIAFSFVFIVLHLKFCEEASLCFL